MYMFMRVSADYFRSRQVRRLKSALRRVSQQYLRGIVQHYDVNAEGKLKAEEIKFSRHKFSSILTSISSYILPKGYPESVGENYQKYVSGQAVDAVFGTVAGTFDIIYACYRSVVFIFLNL